MHARERHFQEELARATARWQTKPSLGDCAPALKEKADLELCQAAASTLAAIIAEPTATPERELILLAPGALALARLSQRMRYLSLAELAQRHVAGDAGVAPVPSASSAARTLAALSQLHKGQRSGHPEQPALELDDGPISQLMQRSIRLERDVIRDFGAYLEYGPLPLRRATFDTVKRLRAEHPQWPALDHLLREAAVLESDADLKADLRQLSASGAPPRARPAQSAETK